MLSVNFTFVFVLLNLIILYLFLRKFLFKRVADMLDSRIKAVEGDLAAGRESRELGDGYRKQHEGALSAAKEECKTFIDDARRRAQKEYDETVSAAKLDASAILESARAQIERERAEAFFKLNEEVADLIIEAASIVVAQNMDSAKNRELVNNFIRNRGAA